MDETVPLAESPPLIPFTDHVSALLKLPVPCTTGMNENFCPARSEVELVLMDTEVIVGGGAEAALTNLRRRKPSVTTTGIRLLCEQPSVEKYQVLPSRLFEILPQRVSRP